MMFSLLVAECGGREFQTFPRRKGGKGQQLPFLNVRVVRFLAQRHATILSEFQRVVEFHQAA